MIAPQMAIFQFRMTVLDKSIKIENRNRQSALAGPHIHHEDAVVVRMRDVDRRIFDPLVANGFSQATEPAVGQAQGVLAVMA